MQELLEIIKYKIRFTLEDIEKIYNELKQEEIRFSEIAKKLELNYSASSIDDTDIKRIINQIKANMQKINEQTQESNVLEDENKLNSILQGLEEIKQDTTIKTGYIREVKERFTRSLQDRVEMLIRDSKLARLEEEKQQVENEKISLIGKIVGKGKLKQVKLDNIELKIQILMLGEQGEEIEKSLEDILAELKAYIKCDLEDKTTVEIQQFLELVETDTQLKEIINEQTLKTKIDEKVNERQTSGYLMPIGEKNKTSNRQQIDILQIQNNEMNRQILNSRARIVTRQNTLSDLPIQNKVLSKFQSMLSPINIATQEEQHSISNIEQE
ncbi:MAG: hypothetical protein HFJ47_02990 [Clostridia bacterium]|nr:hypothetical protein [Clostridia bacterium]